MSMLTKAIVGCLSAVAVFDATASAQIANYTFTQSFGTYVPLTGGTQIATATGALGAAAIDDVVFPDVPLPFTFVVDHFYPQTDCNVSSNGFITFGSAPDELDHFALTQVGWGPRAIAAAFSCDIEAGHAFAADRMLGSNQLTNVSMLGKIQVGDFLRGTGIPVGATITAITGNSITMSALASSTAIAGAVQAYGPWSEIRHETLGSAPNRVFVVQWTNFKRWGASSENRHMSVNFQIHLHETSNEIGFVYGDCSPGLTTAPAAVHVGLRGPNSVGLGNLNNRKNQKGISDWATSTPGTLFSEGQVFNNVAPANVIPSSLSYRWTPVLVASHTMYSSGCGTPPLALSAATTPVIGTTVLYTTSNIPPTAVISAHLVSRVIGFGLPIAGAPGCGIHVDLSFAATTLLFGSPSATYPLVIPNNTGLMGLWIYNQSATLAPGINPGGVLSSNGIWSILSNL